MKKDWLLIMLWAKVFTFITKLDWLLIMQQWKIIHNLLLLKCYILLTERFSGEQSWTEKLLNKWV